MNPDRSYSSNVEEEKFSEVRSSKLRSFAPCNSSELRGINRPPPITAPRCYERCEKTLQAVATCYRQTSREFRGKTKRPERRGARVQQPWSFFLPFFTNVVEHEFSEAVRYSGVFGKQRFAFSITLF
jgi:hypothetical protein